MFKIQQGLPVINCILGPARGLFGVGLLSVSVCDTEFGEGVA